MAEEESLCVRRERRYKTCDDQTLHCDTFVEFDEPVHGSIIDISPSGLRMLSEGKFAVGQAFLTELSTDRLHGVFPGIVRRVEPWVDGKSVLGVQLLEPIPGDVLEILAHEKVINRRREDRVQWGQTAKLDWELGEESIDVEIKDCSQGGLKVMTQVEIPPDARLRLHVKSEATGEDPIIAAKTIWQREVENGHEAGLAFITREMPEVVANIIASGVAVDASPAPKNRSIRLSVLAAAVAAVLGFCLLQIGFVG
jgi:hypothetical protein